MSEMVLAPNLRRLRSLHGLTQDQAAKAAGISRVAYRDLEAGKALEPKASTLLGLASAFSVGVDELLRSAPRLRHVRFRSNKQMKNREQILVDVDRWLRDFNEVETVLDDQQEFQLARVRDEIVTGPVDVGCRAAKAAQLARQALGLTSKEPVRDICGLLEAAGVKVYPIQVQTDAFFGLSVGEEDGGPAIAVNTWNKISVERWIFSAAHELGHLLLHQGAYDVAEAGENKSEEDEANLFAAYFLMPDEGFNNEWFDSMGLRLVERVLKIKRIFRVSYKTVLYRLEQRARANPDRKPSDSFFMRFQVEFKRRTGHGLSKADEPLGLPAEAFRAKEPDHLLPSDFSEDRLCTLVRKAIERDEISLGRGAEILRVSLAEMRDLAGSWV